MSAASLIQFVKDASQPEVASSASVRTALLQRYTSSSWTAAEFSSAEVESIASQLLILSTESAKRSWRSLEPQFSELFKHLLLRAVRADKTEQTRRIAGNLISAIRRFKSATEAIVSVIDPTPPNEEKLLEMLLDLAFEKNLSGYAVYALQILNAWIRVAYIAFFMDNKVEIEDPNGRVETHVWKGTWPHFVLKERIVPKIALLPNQTNDYDLVYEIATLAQICAESKSDLFSEEQRRRLLDALLPKLEGESYVGLLHIVLPLFKSFLTPGYFSKIWAVIHKHTQSLLERQDYYEMAEFLTSTSSLLDNQVGYNPVQEEDYIPRSLEELFSTCVAEFFRNVVCVCADEGKDQTKIENFCLFVISFSACNASSHRPFRPMINDRDGTELLKKQLLMLVKHHKLIWFLLAVSTASEGPIQRLIYRIGTHVLSSPAEAVAEFRRQIAVQNEDLVGDEVDQLRRILGRLAGGPLIRTVDSSEKEEKIEETPDYSQEWGQPVDDAWASSSGWELDEPKAAEVVVAAAEAAEPAPEPAPQTVSAPARIEPKPMPIERKAPQPQGAPRPKKQPPVKCAYCGGPCSRNGPSVLHQGRGYCSQPCASLGKQYGPKQ